MNIKIIKVTNKKVGSLKALELLQKIMNQQTLLLLSGGTSPDELYRLIGNPSTRLRTKLHLGAVAMVDERYGLRMHDNSNEKMVVNTGLIRFLNLQGVPLQVVLEDGVGLEQTAADYEKILKELFFKFPKKIAVMGIGVDGHTAGIKPGLQYDHTKWVVAFDDSGSFGKRITTTFECLEQVDEFIVLVFGENKKWALQKMLEGVDQSVIPVGFYKASGIPITVLTDIDIIDSNDDLGS